MLTADFDYHLPPERIAQTPAAERDRARLLVFSRARPEALEHRLFRDLADYLRPNDLLVLNDSRVIPARLWCQVGSRKIEVLLLKENARNDWWALLRPGKKARVGGELAVLDHASQPTTY